MKRFLSFVLAIFLLTSCAHQSRVITDSSQYSQVELELGEAINQRILQTVPVYREEELNRYVHTIGQNIARVADRKDLAYRFVILEDDRIYTMHAPGGYVYVTTGFFRFLISEIELAGILAHEIGLLQYKDPRLSKMKKAFDLLLRTGSYVGPAFGAIGALSVLGLALVGNATYGEKSLAKQTREADKRALRYLVESGYDPQGLIDPLHRMTDTKSPYRAYLYDYLESHPISSERLNKLNQEFLELPLENKQFDSKRSEFLRVTESVRNTFAQKS
ncbi:MAG: M48 family metalloprotease [Candidatus Omnitrophica bacterium]|nr:M48 family metalloprotease [Candidatus Omnitrophota bacterium]